MVESPPTSHQGPPCKKKIQSKVSDNDGSVKLQQWADKLRPFCVVDVVRIQDNGHWNLFGVVVCISSTNRSYSVKTEDGRISSSKLIWYKMFCFYECVYHFYHSHCTYCVWESEIVCDRFVLIFVTNCECRLYFTDIVFITVSTSVFNFKCWNREAYRYDAQITKILLSNK